MRYGKKDFCDGARKVYLVGALREKARFYSLACEQNGS
jgi:hypothetical protein